MFKVTHHGVSGVPYDSQERPHTLKAAAELCRRLKAEGYGVACYFNGHKLWDAPWQKEFNPDMAQSLAWVKGHGYDGDE